MDRLEAQQVLHEVLDEYRAMAHEELVALMRSPLAFERTGPSGRAYQIEIQAFWDEPRKEGGNLRVLASIDDGRFLTAFFPLTSDFIMRPDDTLVDD